MSFIVTNETPCACCTQHRTARVIDKSNGDKLKVTLSGISSEPGEYFELPNGVSVAGAWDASGVSTGDYADELAELLRAVDARTPHSLAVVEGRWTLANTHSTWLEAVTRWAKIGGAEHVAIRESRPDKSTLRVYVAVATSEFEGDAEQYLEQLLDQYEAWGEGLVYEFDDGDAWCASYGTKALADDLAYYLDTDSREGRVLAEEVEKVLLGY